MKELPWTRGEVATLLGVTPARVSQIAKEMGIRIRHHPQYGWSYRLCDVSKMQKRDTKPGPKRATKARGK